MVDAGDDQVGRGRRRGRARRSGRSRPACRRSRSRRCRLRRSTSSTESGERVVMLRAVALRLESGAMRDDSSSSSADQRPTQALQPGGADPVVVGEQDAHPVDSRCPRPAYTAGRDDGPAGHRIRRRGLPRLGPPAGAADRAGRAGGGLAQVLREEIQLTVAGRTDTGVHALGQVASFDTEARCRPTWPAT